MKALAINADNVIWIEIAKNVAKAIKKPYLYPRVIETLAIVINTGQTDKISIKTGINVWENTAKSNIKKPLNKNHLIFINQ